MRTFHAYGNRAEMMSALADQVAQDLIAALGQRPRATLSVPGGTTPGPVFDKLARTALPWDRVDVVLNDERWVPEDHERSNTRLIRQRLLTGKAKDAGYLPLYAPAPEPEGALQALADGLAPHLPISVLILGMGADMHTASLFPGADRLAEGLSPDAPVLLPMRAPGAPEPRITFSARVLQDADKTHLLIAGAEKRDALEKAKTLPPADAPVAAILPQAHVHWAP